LTTWWADYAQQRYGKHEPKAEQAWKILGETVYGKTQETKSMYGEKARDGVTSYMFSGNEEQVQPDWFNLTKVFTAWKLLTEVGAAFNAHAGNMDGRTVTDATGEQRRGVAEKNQSVSGTKQTGDDDINAKNVGGGSHPLPETLKYDIVNTGREVLAKISNRLFARLVNATGKAAVQRAGEDLASIAADMDMLLCSDFGLSAACTVRVFRQKVTLEDAIGSHACSLVASRRVTNGIPLGCPHFLPVGTVKLRPNTEGWINAAIKLAQGSKSQARHLEWAARAQPTTWLPACPPTEWPTPSGNVSNQVTGTCGTRSDLADYSNKQWGGLISGFYSPRQQCYVKLVQSQGSTSSNDPAYNKCLDKVAWDFQHDFGGIKTPICGGGDGGVVGDPVAISLKLLQKYEDLG
jgi:hypothetical protein